MTKNFIVQYFSPLLAFFGSYNPFSILYLLQLYINVYKFWIHKFLLYAMSLLDLRRHPKE
jgi:hypothetical protein